MIVLLLVFSLKLLFFFFFKQKTAYEMRISDWSSDVCSSDLTAGRWSPSPPSDWSANGLCIAPMTMTEGDMVAVRLGTGEVGVGAAWLTKLAHPPAEMIATARTDAMPADRTMLVEIGRASCMESVVHYDYSSVDTIYSQKTIKYYISE